MGLKACPLCFYQRTFIMGIVAVLGIGLLTGERHRGVLNILALPLAVAGFGVAVFHEYLELSGKLECPAGVLGVGTAPQQSLAVLTVLLVVVSVAIVRGRNVREFRGLVLAGAAGLGLLLAWGSVASVPPMPAAPTKAYNPEKQPLDMCRPALPSAVTWSCHCSMRPELFGSISPPLEDFLLLKRAVPVLILALFWCWETWRPFFGQREGRWKHAVRNVAIGVFNTVILGLAFGSITMTVTDWTEQNQYGLLNTIGLAGLIRFGLALVLLDGWMYVWHRANHTMPFLWRFHRMHHSDRHMDVTTATRFHLGERIGASVLRLGLIPLFG